MREAGNIEYLKRNCQDQQQKAYLNQTAAAILKKKMQPSSPDVITTVRCIFVKSN